MKKNETMTPDEACTLLGVDTAGLRLMLTGPGNPDLPEKISLRMAMACRVLLYLGNMAGLDPLLRTAMTAGREADPAQTRLMLATWNQYTWHDADEPLIWPVERPALFIPADRMLRSMTAELASMRAR